MNWKKLTSAEQIEEIKTLSQERPILIFKHSTRCSVSSMSLDRLLRNWKSEDEEKIVPYYLDLVAYRQISNLVEEVFHVPHESPQVLIIRDGVAIYDNSHFGISYPDIMDKI
ncbi:bacillithiol system redox-active protein YtxJ [Algoriphagus zhangzhouensis]|uniref:Bacillithiol system protein YtxJ n=1 Tax=Algoriphagus zhangzhouensis TaxID=1073327 RepID=A0A1M7ZBY5_9BACT|nr:bacillithiol system redox-active protein YtxJ [Algoriphagus zhangzhouensis]TDY46835.1 bacillithiol system protein YtxJ [Algoriphagus zhangzhouensis]SHO62206.1 bacillithiol system protein YtxJ [Algoriphagus zhangzhouensis]